MALDIGKTENESVFLIFRKKFSIDNKLLKWKGYARGERYEKDHETVFNSNISLTACSDFHVGKNCPKISFYSVNLGSFCSSYRRFLNDSFDTVWRRVCRNKTVTAAVQEFFERSRKMYGDESNWKCLFSPEFSSLLYETPFALWLDLKD